MIAADLKIAADLLLNQTADMLDEMRRADPDAGYAARLYECPVCVTVDAAVAPADELLDDYPCPGCKGPQRPVTDVSDVVRRPTLNRAQRRAQRGRR